MHLCTHGCWPTHSYHMGGTRKALQPLCLCPWLFPSPWLGRRCTGLMHSFHMSCILRALQPWCHALGWVWWPGKMCIVLIKFYSLNSFSLDCFYHATPERKCTGPTHSSYFFSWYILIHLPCFPSKLQHELLEFFRSATDLGLLKSHGLSFLHSFGTIL